MCLFNQSGTKLLGYSYENNRDQEAEQRSRQLSLAHYPNCMNQFPCYLKLLGAVIKVILSSPGLLQHLCTLLFLHLFFVLQICYFLILIFNLPAKERSTQSMVQSSFHQCWAAGPGTVAPSSATTSLAQGHQHQTHPQALPSTVNPSLHFAHYY